MKYLLYSKVFRKNLAKWIFMYIATILLFTSVVTYSKYFSSFASNDEARVAKFNVKIDYIDDYQDCTKKEICVPSNKVYGPDNEISYYFKVDTRELEVRTSLKVIVNLKTTNFRIVDVYLQKDNGEFVSIDGLPNYTNIKNNNLKYKGFEEMIAPNSGKEKIYKVTIKYTKDPNTTTSDYDIYNKIVSPDEMIAIDYIVSQEK